jgi:tetratricopeptide (TPR) repeat protein
MSKEKIIEAAEKLVKAGKYDKAIKEFQKLLADEPNDMRAKLKIAEIMARAKDIPNALKTYREVADQYAADNFHLKAIAVYKTILKLSPTLIEVNEKLGDLYHKVGLDTDALNQYYIVANYYDNKGLMKEAMQIRKKIVEVDPSNTTGRVRLAELMQAEGQTDQSIREYERAAEILTSKRDRDGLVEVFEKMLYYRPDNIDMMIKLCRIYFEKRDFKKALRKIDTSPPEIKKHLEVNELWAEALLEDRQVDASRRKFKELYAMALEKKDAERTARIYSRILQEFGDDQDYLNDLEEIRKNAGLEMKTVAPKFRQDFEKTEMVDLNKFDESNKRK